MKLIGMLDSPYVRRVAISLEFLDVPFKHESVSVFSTFELAPLASASIGQAHAATLADGSEVVVKVRRPGVVYLEVAPAAAFEEPVAARERMDQRNETFVPHVLATLERTHDPENVPRRVEEARAAGLAVSLDLIYGTPGESADDWARSLDDALACDPDHISAYALIVEEGTKLARQIARGEVPPVDDDLHAAFYEAADARLTAAGYHWYEVSNWARDPSQRSRHNRAYLLGHDWWGVGPGAHSHVGGVRWWNVKHPAAYAQRLAAGLSPAAGRETLDAENRRVERVLLQTRLVEGLPTDALTALGRRAVAQLIADELVEPGPALRGTVVLTLRGRLLADAVVRRLLPD